MIVCGVELKSNEAIVCLLTLKDGVFSLPDCRSTRVVLQSTTGSSALKHFQNTFAKLMEDYGVSRVVIRERPQKGKFAGSAVGFKCEAVLELLDGEEDLSVEVMTAAAIKAAIAEHPVPVKFSDTGLKVFQEVAFNTAYAALAASELS